ncbi:hypothetical protein TrLO_g9423 [Triparma laevis f. longispina]|uniref:Uncharacterized protein n=1 Tax=Triparma laevis f. longispina TaxID=1714387 RepID=A0A9W6ZF48_9STRA|nr:hypothetical protein TrLO_g9423 [Triparma laevis f. longispina]
MSKSVANEFIEGHESREMGRTRGLEDEGNEEEEELTEVPLVESLTISTVVSTVPATMDQFMHTPEFRIPFVDFVHVQTLMALRPTTKGWKATAEEVIDELRAVS